MAMAESTSHKPSKKTRFSAQRACIQQIVSGQSGHLSVEEVFERAKRVSPRISLATVYRNLQQLEALSAISSVQGKDQRLYYEAFATPHHHFICESCSAILNVDNPSLPTCMSCIHRASDWELKSMVTTLYGVCPQCQKDKVRTPTF